jgi:endoglucanase
MGRGINARYFTPNDGTYDLLWDSQQFDDFEAEGLDNLRMVLWYPNDNGSAPWTIDASVLTNLGAMIDSVNAHGMLPIINYHQPFIKRNNLFTQAQIDRFLSHWAQIADYCSSRYDSTQVIYELMNEPDSQMTADDWNEIQQDAIDSIRVYDTEKYIIITPHGWSKIEYLDDMVVPTDPSDRMILSIHYYDPEWMIKQGVTWATSDPTEGPEWLYNDWPNIWPFWDNLATDFQVLTDWNTTNLPITIGEFGTVNGDIHTPHRYNYALMLSRFYEGKDYSWSWWDDTGSFGIYDTITDSWDDSIKDALFYDALPAFEAYDSIIIYQSDFSLSNDGWTIFVDNGAGMTTAPRDGSLLCWVTDVGTGPLDAQIISPAMTAAKDSMYRVTYTISSIGGKPFLADIINDEFNWKNITELDGGGEYSRVFTYEMAWDTDASNHIRFLLGASSDSIYIA